MPLVSRLIPSLLNGVSQQPPSLRRASQGELMINGYPSLSDGLIKRMPSQHLAKVSATSLGGAFVWGLDYGGTNQFLLVLQDADLKIYDTAGNSKTISTPDGKTYLDVTDPLTDFSVVQVEDVAYITNKTKLADVDATVAGGTYQGEVQTFANLPGAPTNGDVYKIVGDDSQVLTGYYVKYDGTNAVWKEAPFPGTNTTFDATLMPHKLTFNGSTFTFQKETWGVRPSGDLTSLPEPNFVGRAIRDILFFRNRLGFLAGEYVVMSRAGPDYQNFWSQSATGPLDNDPIDVRAANVKISTLNFGVPFNKQLLTLSSGQQFVMGTAAGQLLTPNTASIDVATSYAANSIAKPVSVGNNVYFPSENALFASLREYYVSDDVEIANTAEDVTAHVPAYIPAGIFKIAIAENDDTLFLVTTGDQTRIYMYKFFWIGDQKVQSAWSYWQFDSADTILSIDVIGEGLYFLVERADGVHLEHIDLQDDPTLSDVGFVIHLDKRVKLTGTYAAGPDETTWTLPYAHAGLSIQVVKGEDWPNERGELVPNTTLSSTHDVKVSGDLSAYAVYIGVPYTFQWRFSEIFLREGNDQDQGAAILNAHLHLRLMNIRFSQTGFLRAEVVPRPGAATYQYSFNGMVLDTSDLVVGTPQITTGTFRFPVMADASKVTIDLINDSHMPSAVVSAEWAGNFSPRPGRRR